MFMRNSKFDAQLRTFCLVSSLRVMPISGSRISSGTLFPQEFRRRNAGDLFEETGEVVRKLKTQQVGGFAYVVPVHQEALTLFNHEGMDVADGRAAGRFVNYVAQITG